MANNGPTIKLEPGALPGQAWSEEQLEQALDELKQMHIKLRGLRTTIPRMLEPLSIKQPDPETMFKAFTESVNAAKNEVQDFQDFRKSEKITNILNHATERRRQEPNGIKAWRATDHPDWTTIDPAK